MLDVPCELRVVSAHRSPDHLFPYAEAAAGRGIQVIVAGAGGAAHLPGMLASKTTLPVIGVPIPTEHLGGLDSLLSIVQMPRGIPVATVAIGNAENAAILAIEILALSDPALAASIDGLSRRSDPHGDGRSLQRGLLPASVLPGRLTVQGLAEPRDRPIAADATGPGVGFRADIEGLRGIAVLLVVLFHAGLPIPGGFVGVDVFFVVSGFLITGLLVREFERTRRVSLSNFYARRIRRLLPAATVVVLVTLAGAYLFVGLLDQPGVMTDGVASALSVANIRFALAEGNYFSAIGQPSPFLHFWSLSVEEQFYLVWPAVLLIAARGGHGWIGALLLVILAVSFAANVVPHRCRIGVGVLLAPDARLATRPRRPARPRRSGRRSAASMNRLVAFGRPSWAGARSPASWRSPCSSAIGRRIRASRPWGPRPRPRY